MTKEELKKAESDLKKFIECFYECKFTGKIKIEEIYEKTFYIRLILNQDERPLQMTYDGDFDKFIEFVKKEIGSRQLNKTEYYTGYKNEERRNN